MIDRIKKVWKNMTEEQNVNLTDDIEKIVTDAQEADSSENVNNENNNSEDEGISEEIVKLKSDLSDQRDKYIRLVAEFDNYKKRTIKERIDLIKTASQDIIVELLSVIDDFERAEKLAKEQNNDAIYPEGMALVYQKLIGLLKSKGLEAMESTNQNFDSTYHEAITEFPAPSDDMKGKVFDTIEKGYMLGEKIIRFAKVVVAK